MPPRPGSTPRDPSRPTDGHAGAFVAHLLGRPWAPHQRYVADVAGELLPNGRYAYPICVVEEPRQVGKTVGLFDILLGRALQYRDYRCAYTAQTGHVVSERFVDRFEELEPNELLEPRLKLRRSGGTERVTVRKTRSYIKAFPPKDGALRSSSLDAVVVDEAQEHDEALGVALDRTIIPVFTARPRRQLWVVGTAGTDASQYFARYLKAARAGEPGYALFSFGAPDGVDPDDETLWETWHPGLAAGLTDVDALRVARTTLGQAGFAREYATIWTRVQVHAIDPEKWRSVQRSADMPPGRLALGVDVAADRSGAAIVIAGPRNHVEVIEPSIGVAVPSDVEDARSPAAARALELQAAHGAPIAIDSVGPSGTLRDELERAGAELLPTNLQHVANAAAGFLDLLDAGALEIYPHPALDDAVQIAEKRSAGDAGFAWSRKTSAGSIAPLVATCAALWGRQRLPDPGPQPAVYAE